MTIRLRFLLWYFCLLAPLLLISGYMEHRRLESFYLLATAARLESEARGVMDSRSFAAPLPSLPTHRERAQRLVNAFEGWQPRLILFSENGDRLAASKGVGNSDFSSLRPPDPDRLTPGAVPFYETLSVPSGRFLVVWLPIRPRPPRPPFLSPLGAGIPPPGGVPPPDAAPPPPSPDPAPPGVAPSASPGLQGPPPGTDEIAILLPLAIMDHTMKSDARGWSLRMLLVLGAAAVALWVLLQAVLTPLERMATLADRIRAGERNLRMNEAHSGKGRDELSRLSAAFDRMLDAVTSSEEEMRRFLAEASHELRTPLTAVGGYVDVMRRGAVGSDADRRRIFQAIRDEIDRMARLVSELLTLARLQGSLEREELLRLDVPLSPLLENLLEGARLRSAGRALVLQVAPDGPEAAVLQGDPDRLRQAFGNLIENALIHSRPGGGLEILLSTDAARNFAEVSFQDDGPVILADRRSPIFQRFVKGPASPGSGLGLTIVQAILAAHGGSVRLETNERGNRFVVRLPLREGVSSPERLINGSAPIQ